MNTFIEQMSELNDEAISFDDLDDAIIGIGKQWGGPYLFIYSADKIVECLAKNGMEYEEAVEWFGYNVECLYAGPHTPIIVDDMQTG